MKKILAEDRGVKLLEYTYPDGRKAYRVVKGTSVLAMTISRPAATKRYVATLKEVV